MTGFKEELIVLIESLYAFRRNEFNKHTFTKEGNNSIYTAPVLKHELACTSIQSFYFKEVESFKAKSKCRE